MFQVQAISSGGYPLFTEQWLTYLTFRHEASFFGLTLSDEGIFHAADLVDLLQPSIRHPYVQLTGADPFSSEKLGQMEKVAALYEQPTLWNEVSVASGEVTHPHLTEEENSYFQAVVTKTLYGAGLTMQDVPSLLPFFQDGGWPLTKRSTNDTLFLALRLVEPEVFSDEWTLETVLRGKRNTAYWTPPKRKMNLPIGEAVPEKWADQVDWIHSTQQAMLELLDLSPQESFFSQTLEDVDVRKFLRDDAAKLQALGFEVILPAWLRSVKEQKMKVRTNASVKSYKTSAGLNEVLQFNWQFSLNGHEISEEQFRDIVDNNRQYIQAGNEWFRMDAHWMHEIRKWMEQTEEEEWTVKDLLFRETPDVMLLEQEDMEEEEEEDPLIAFEFEKALGEYVQLLREKEGLPETDISPLLQTELRPYQVIGFNWLVFMRENGFGVCLADDMGLGKTVQLISYLLHIHRTEKTPKQSIIICPTSVLGNWQKELERFAPDLHVHVHYGNTREKEAEGGTLFDGSQADVVLTTYGTASQDAHFLSEKSWTSITLDEAQNIKNMHTKQSKAIRKMHGDHHIALTGTPVENRLSELWAIFDFIYKGYLGSFSKFQENFIAPIERENSEAHKKKLRTKIQPFLLRRTKQDSDLLLGLPDKQEKREFCPLTVEQASLYEGLIAETLEKVQQLSGFEKKGLILKMLSKLKQLCNHPALYLKEAFDDAEDMLERSEKLKRVVQLAAEIAENGEQCLIFTQYIGMGHLIQHCLSEIYDIDVPFLSGSMPKGQRDALVDSFQRKEFPVFLLSLKAGGTGLNLTAASHVLHADRWWNPAVENQATDRAYRIGQTKFVEVHKFVTIGTIEEKIDKLLIEKQALSDDLIQSSNWITELPDDDLRELLTFG
ncbi:DEAD/DEAH box helicase [Paenisporosarcina cavernae]|uniref:DEAD/DEAH box helicase n=2 Tax=Paenisporosarcina cavernae TaxID=2320858 RepID=A0A385YW35_9BACL|nr:DEAD/DEAH box helicase [Paenisporosarcina cavernae]